MHIVKIYYIFVLSSNKRYEEIQSHRSYETSKRDGWIKVHQRGSHRQFKHPTKSGKVTLNGKESDNVSQEILNSIWKQAGWK